MSPTPVDWHVLVAERDAWVAHNFPGTNHLETTVGCLEEAGELAHAELKRSQNIRGSAEKHDADARDAVGDILVYLLGVISNFNIEASDPPPRSSHEAPNVLKAVLRVGSAVGELCGSVAYHESCDDEVHYVITAVYDYADIRGWDAGRLLLDTWASVRERDWIKYPNTGRPPKTPVYGDATGGHPL